MKNGDSIVFNFTFQLIFAMKIYFYKKYDKCILKREIQDFYLLRTECHTITRLSTVNV